MRFCPLKIWKAALGSGRLLDAPRNSLVNAVMQFAIEQSYPHVIPGCPYVLDVVLESEIETKEKHDSGCSQNAEWFASTVLAAFASSFELQHRGILERNQVSVESNVEYICVLQNVQNCL